MALTAAEIAADQDARAARVLATLPPALAELITAQRTSLLLALALDELSRARTRENALAAGSYFEGLAVATRAAVSLDDPRRWSVADSDSVVGYGRARVAEALAALEREQ